MPALALHLSVIAGTIPSIHPVGPFTRRRSRLRTAPWDRKSTSRRCSTSPAFIHRRQRGFWQLQSAWDGITHTAQRISFLLRKDTSRADPRLCEVLVLIALEPETHWRSQMSNIALHFRYSRSAASAPHCFTIRETRSAKSRRFTFQSSHIPPASDFVIKRRSGPSAWILDSI